MSKQMIKSLKKQIEKATGFNKKALIALLKRVEEREAAKVKVPKAQITQLAKAREAYFKKMGFGKYKKAKKKAKAKRAA